MSNVVEEYGWQSSIGPHSCNYITPAVKQILKRLGVRRVCDLGSGNGSLAGSLSVAGCYVAGIEYDKTGVEIARKNYPDINFYNLSVHDDPAPVLLEEGKAFDAVISTEVIEHLFSPHQLPIFARQILRGGGLSRDIDPLPWLPEESGFVCL